MRGAGRWGRWTVVTAIVWWAIAGFGSESPVGVVSAEVGGVTLERPEVSPDALRDVPSSSNRIRIPTTPPPTSASTTTTTTSTTTASTTTRTPEELPANPASNATGPESPTSTIPLTLANTSTLEGRAEVGRQALDSMHLDWRTLFPEWQVEFLAGREGLRALTYPHEQRIEVFVRLEDTTESLHRVLAHEFGHVIDVELNSSDDRDRWAAQRRLAESVAWWPGESAPDFATGAGDFAEAFAVLETGVRSQSSVARQPTPEDLAVLAELIAD